MINAADHPAAQIFTDAGATAKATDTSSFAGAVNERRPIAEQVANRITGMIKSGNLKAGDKLPTEAQMCIAFGISRPPLREALKALTLMGVLASRQGGRYTVTDLSSQRLMSPFKLVLSMADYDVDEHFHARSIVDLELVRLCAVNATDDERQRILALAVDGRAFHHDPVAFRLLDLEFHQAINNAAGNKLLAALAQQLYDIALDVRREASAMEGVIEKSVRQHTDVAQAIVAGDAISAVEAYRTHLEHVRDTTVQAAAVHAGREPGEEVA